MKNHTLRRAFGGLSGRRALVMPYAAGRHMAPGEVVWESLVAPARGSVDVFGLVLPWGILPEKSLTQHQELLVHSRPPRETVAARDAAARVRAWLHTEGKKYDKIALVAYGRLLPVWSRAVERSPAAERVQLIAVNSRGRGLYGATVRRQVKDVVLA